MCCTHLKAEVGIRQVAGYQQLLVDGCGAPAVGAPAVGATAGWWQKHTQVAELACGGERATERI